MEKAADNHSVSLHKKEKQRIRGFNQKLNFWRKEAVVMQVTCRYAAIQKVPATDHRNWMRLKEERILKSTRSRLCILEMQNACIALIDDVYTTTLENTMDVCYVIESFCWKRTSCIFSHIVLETTIIKMLFMAWDT